MFSAISKKDSLQRDKILKKKNKKNTAFLKSTFQLKIVIKYFWRLHDLQFYIIIIRFIFLKFGSITYCLCQV